MESVKTSIKKHQIKSNTFAILVTEEVGLELIKQQSINRVIRKKKDFSTLV